MTVANTMRQYSRTISDFIFCIKSCLLPWPVVYEQGYFYNVYILGMTFCYRLHSNVLHETDYVFTTMQSDFRSWLLADGIIADVLYLSGHRFGI